MKKHTERLEWTTVRPTPATIAERAQREAERFGGVVESVSGIKLSMTRRRQTRFTVTVTITL